MGEESDAPIVGSIEMIVEGPHGNASRLQSFLDEKTTWQRLVLAVGGLASAAVAVGTLLVGINSFGRERATPASSSGPAPAGKETAIANQSADADSFVRFLLGTDGRPVQLNHKVLAPDLGSHVRLEYDCAKQTGCSYTRLEAAAFIPARVEGGVWYQGCYSVVGEGAGYGADHLDLEFTLNGPTCP